MRKWHKWIRLVLLFGGMLVVGGSMEPQAATFSTLDIFPNDRARDTDTVDLGTVRPLDGSNREMAKPLPSGNPLWSVPLSVLTATQQRPIFSALRRPPPRSEIAPQVEHASGPPPKPDEPDRPPLALIGVVVGDSGAIAVFVDRTNQKIVRLRRGETYAGWDLITIARREATLAKGDRAETIALKGTDAPVAAGVPEMSAPGATVTGTSFAPE